MNSWFLFHTNNYRISTCKVITTSQNPKCSDEEWKVRCNIFITLYEIQGNRALLTAGLWISQHIIKRHLLESLQLTLKKCACNLFSCHVFHLFTAILKCSVQIKHTRMKYITVSGDVWNCTALNSYALREGISKQFTTPSYMALGFTVCT